MEKQLRELLLLMAARYVDATKCGYSTLARRCRNDSGFFDRLQNVEKSFTLRTFDEVVAWFDRNWPETCNWPTEVPRPSVQHDADAPDGDVAVTEETQGVDLGSEEISDRSLPADVVGGDVSRRLPTPADSR